MGETGGGIEVEVEVGEIGGGVEVAGLEVATVAAEVVQWVEAVPLVAVLVDVAGVTSASGSKTSKRFTLLSSRKKGTGWSPGSRLPKTTPPNTLFVCFSNLMQTPIFTFSFRRSWMGDNWSAWCSASQLFCHSRAQGHHL